MQQNSTTTQANRGNRDLQQVRQPRSTAPRRRAILTANQEIEDAIEAILETDREVDVEVARNRWNTNAEIIKNLIDRIVTDEDNDQALALVALTDMLTYSKDDTEREMVGIMARNYAFAATIAFAQISDAFRKKALSLTSQLAT